MNRKQLVLLIASVVVIGGIGLFLSQRKNNPALADQKLGQKLFPDLAVNDIEQIRFQRRDAELSLVKKEDRWRVKERGDYPADFGKISDFLLKAKNLKVAQSEEIGPSQYARLELEEPAKGAGSGTLLEFKDKAGKTVQSAIVGKQMMRKSARPSPYGDDGGFPAGRYVLLPADTKNVLLLSDPLNDVAVEPANWLNKEFFKVENLKSVALTSTNTADSWKITRETVDGTWTSAEAKQEELDAGKVSGVANSISSPSFVDVVMNPDSDQTGLDQARVITLETFDGFTYTLKIGALSGNDNYYFTVAVAAAPPKQRTIAEDEKPEDKEQRDREFADKNKQLEEKLEREKQFEKWTYLVAKWTFDPLLRTRAELLVEKKEEKEDSATNQTEGITPALDDLLNPVSGDN